LLRDYQFLNNYSWWNFMSFGSSFWKHVHCLVQHTAISIGISQTFSLKSAPWRRTSVLSKTKNYIIFNFISSRLLLGTRSVNVTATRITESLSTSSRWHAHIDRPIDALLLSNGEKLQAPSRNFFVTGYRENPLFLTFFLSFFLFYFFLSLTYCTYSL